MCDYSLCGIPNRLAAEGEELVVHKFSTGSMGLASPADLPSRDPIREAVPKQTFWQALKSFFEPTRQPSTAPAVCIPPGAHLILKDIPADLQRQCHVCEEEGVMFTQLSADVNSYRDAIRFSNGYQIRLQDLREGMRLEVLSLAGAYEYIPVMSEALR
jgi:hypothetical protein